MSKDITLNKLERLQELIIDKYITALENDEVEVKDLSSVVTLLKNNKILAQQDDKRANEFIEIQKMVKK